MQMEACFRADQRQTASKSCRNKARTCKTREEHKADEGNREKRRGVERAAVCRVARGGGRPQRRKMVVQHLQQTRAHPSCILFEDYENTNVHRA